MEYSVNMEHIEKRFKKEVAECFWRHVEKIDLDAHFEKDLGYNEESLEPFELLMALEETFEIDIPDKPFETIETLRDLLEYIKMRLGVPNQYRAFSYSRLIT